MAEWTLRPVEPASLTTAALHRDPREQPRDRRPPRSPARSVAGPALLQRLIPGQPIAPYELEVELGQDNQLIALIVRERESGRIVRRIEGSGVDALLHEPASPGLLMERSG